MLNDPAEVVRPVRRLVLHLLCSLDKTEVLVRNVMFPIPGCVDPFAQTINRDGESEAGIAHFLLHRGTELVSDLLCRERSPVVTRLVHERLRQPAVGDSHMNELLLRAVLGLHARLGLYDTGCGGAPPISHRCLAQHISVLVHIKDEGVSGARILRIALKMVTDRLAWMGEEDGVLGLTLTLQTDDLHVLLGDHIRYPRFVDRCVRSVQRIYLGA